MDVLVLDKTGTVTTGKPQVTEIKTLGNHTQKEVLESAATAEKCSEHPLAQAILNKANEEKIDFMDSKCFEVKPGLGVSIQNGDCQITVGNEKMMEKYSIPLNDEAKDKLAMQQTGQTMIYVAKDKTVIGSIFISDTLRRETDNIMTKAQLNGIKRTIMLTGDNPQAANHIAECAGIDEVFSNQLPDEKVNCISRLKKEGHTVAMVGDGINDAPALAEADVGIAMGLSGNDVAIETAGITLATDNLEGVPKLLRIGRATISIIKQNIAFAMLVNLTGITLSIMGIIPPLFAAMIHEANALIVMLNSLRLLTID